MVHPEDRDEALAALFRSLGAEGGAGIEMRIVRPDGESRWVLARSRPRRGVKGSAPKLLGGLLDVTERQRMEENLRIAQRLQAVGRLAAGVVHDFNNLLTIVGPTLELAARRSPPSLAEMLAIAREAGGWLACASAPGAGATFELVLPAAVRGRQGG